jgi:hypothetical protein
MHGFVDKDEAVLSVQCLRKDLPPLPEPETTPEPEVFVPAYPKYVTDGMFVYRMADPDTLIWCCSDGREHIQSASWKTGGVSLRDITPQRAADLLGRPVGELKPTLGEPTCGQLFEMLVNLRDQMDAMNKTFSGGCRKGACADV